MLDAEAPEATYFVGAANVGKSTLLNHLLTDLSGEPSLTASRMPGTTLGMVPNRVTWPSGRKTVVVDTPGLVHKDRVVDLLCADCLKSVIPRSRLKPKVFQLNPGQTLFVGGMARLDFAVGERQPVVLYVSNDLVIHRRKLENAEEFQTSHADDILKVPCPDCRVRLGKTRQYPVLAGKFYDETQAARRILGVLSHGCDLVIPGLGWITLTGKDFSGALTVSSQVVPSSRRRILGDLSRNARQFRRTPRN
jgi:hypothetical protein